MRSVVVFACVARPYNRFTHPIQGAHSICGGRGVVEEKNSFVLETHPPTWNSSAGKEEVFQT